MTLDLVYRCGPCQFMVPILNEVSTRLKDKIQVVKIDTEKYPSIADKYRIEALPTFIMFKDGEPYDRFVSQFFFSFFIWVMLSSHLVVSRVCVTLYNIWEFLLLLLQWLQTLTFGLKWHDIALKFELWNRI